MKFNYIRHKLQKYRKDNILDYCFGFLLKFRNQKDFAIWDVFLLMKWTYLYAEKDFPYKELNGDEFQKILNYIPQLLDSHFDTYLKNDDIIQFLQIHCIQQFYLRTQVFREITASQYKLFIVLKHKQDLERIFENKTKISIEDFLNISLTILLYTDSNGYDGTLEPVKKVLVELFGSKTVENFISLLSIDRNTAMDKIHSYTRNINDHNLQPLEQSFLTKFPFQSHRSKIRIAHRSLVSYFVNYYIHDFLKTEHKLFGEEFGKRFEKYIEFGIKEMNMHYKDENDLKRQLPPNSKVPDFLITDINIYIECKAIELQPYTSANPTDIRLRNALKESIYKAYLKQLAPSAHKLSPRAENFAFILTYKELYWRVKDLIKFIPENDLPKNEMLSLPPDNVFIIDIHTWHRIIQLVKDKKIDLLEVMKRAKSENANPTTSKLLFEMSLPDETLKYNFTFLEHEIKQLNKPFE